MDLCPWTLHVYHRDTDSCNERAIQDRETEKYVLLSGDISGIQQYVFDMATEGAEGISRAYRAHSFYTSMLTHAASLRLLSDLGLPCFGRVLGAGGRFALLVSNTTQARETIASVRREIDSWILEHHRGMLTLGLSDRTWASGSRFIGTERVEVDHT